MGTGEETVPKVVWVFLDPAIYEKSKQKMCFSQYQEEMNLGRRCPYIFSNETKLQQITKAVGNHCNKVFSR